MFRVLKYLKEHLKIVLVIIVLLLIQAFCDLALPQYTSDIIDVGIQNKGIEHALPEKIKKDEFEYAQLFMTKDEKKTWKSSYNKEKELYVRKSMKESKLEEYDTSLSVALIANSQLSNVEKNMFLKQLGMQMKTTVTEAQVQALYQKMGLEYKLQKKKGKKGIEYYIDERPLFQAMIQQNMMPSDSIVKIRKEMEKKFKTMGDSFIKSSAIQYTISQEKMAGIDINAKQKRYLWIEGAKMLAVALVMAACMVMVGLFASRIGASIGRDIRGKMYEKVMSFSNAEMNKFSTASLITRSTNDIQQIQMVEMMFLRMILYAPILGIGGIIKVVGTNSGMGWITILSVIALLVLVSVLMFLAMPKFKLMQTLVDRINLVSREILTGLSVIRAFGREDREEERFEGANVALTRNMLFTNRVMTFMMPCMMFIMFGTSILIVWVSADKIDQGTIQVGTMTAFITYTMQIVMSFLMLTMLSVMMPRAAVAAERIDEVLNTEVTIADAPDAMDYHIEKGTVEFKDVSFAFPGSKENILNHISFKAEPGKTTAIIGGTGSGKSTMINLIPRFYDVSQGEILIDDVDVRKMSQSSLREEIGYVPQKGVLFSGTIASNLRFGKEDATKEQLEEAIAIAQAKEIVDGKSDGYESAIAQGGSNVSGGQKQRFSIARAIVKNPKIYIFDDSFSALDYKTDAILRKELQKKTKDATVLIVAQRISTILHADQIIVLDEGEIAGIGNHQQLMQTCEVYKEIAQSQLSENDLKKLSEEGKEAE